MTWKLTSICSLKSVWITNLEILNHMDVAPNSMAIHPTVVKIFDIKTKNANLVVALE